MPKTDEAPTTSLSDEVNRLVQEGWHFRNTGTGFAAVHDDGRYFSCTKVADVVASIRESETVSEDEKAKEAADTNAALFDSGVDPATQAAIDGQ